MTFKRARNDEQRGERRRQILDTAAAMLTEMPVAKLSLNELSRRAGLAKPNVLRYFESREAVLLQLLDTEIHDWIAELEQSLEPTSGTPRQRGDQLAAILAKSITGRPVLCDLISTQAAVLEHNVSTEVAIRHKNATLRAFQSLVRLSLHYLPELGTQDAFRLVGLATLTVSAAWPYSRPTEALLAAYTSDPALAPMQVDFTDLVRQALEVTISGLLARGEDLPLGAGPLS
ncbi:TetR family transcriptional regulator [Nonomuraea sp. NPDC050022]|uniref:TetR/AcrR family transcriptional regulator n=1 Tax=unclassified Nonomuraea TaxID=2593643 RepID=UPI00340868CB